jgi:hypothetical protein
MLFIIVSSGADCTTDISFYHESDDRVLVGWDCRTDIDCDTLTSSGRNWKPKVMGLVGFSMLEIVLYQPDEVLQRRAGSPERLAAYVKILRAECAAFFRKATDPELLDIVVAIRPERRSKIWFASTTRAENDQALQELRAQLESIKPPDVREGAVAFALIASIAGERHPAEQAGEPFTPPIPPAWQEVISKHSGMVAIPDDILESVWQESTNETAEDEVSRVR